MEFVHYSVLLEEAVDMLALRDGGIYVDCTLGGGGHTKHILNKLNGGRVIGIDRDDFAIANAIENIKDPRFTAVKSNFCELDSVLFELGIDKVDGIIMDLGVSSHQLDTAERGFSYSTDAPLDMRMDTSSSLSAADVVNGYSEQELARIMHEYGEERASRRIASEIARRRAETPYTSTKQLYDTVFASVKGSPADKLSSVKRVFQAVRIEVNGELDSVKTALDKAVELLAGGGRLSVISFHSLEDRIVKTSFARYANGCTCPKDFPICVCGNKPKMKIITKKPLLPTDKELAENSRSHSAKLRGAERL